VTANATVTPNWKKSLPIIPPMNATGMNTATTASDRREDGEADLVGAVLGRSMVSFPSPTCRTMFSRTTMASSISRPMASESASSVIVLSVKFSAHMAKKAEMMDTGSVTR